MAILFFEVILLDGIEPKSLQIKMPNTVLSNRHIRFSAVPQAKYILPAVQCPEKLSKEVILYEIEPQDLLILKRLEKQVREETLLSDDNGENRKAAHYSILRYALTHAKRILRHRQEPSCQFQDTSVIYLAVADKQPCGLLIGNMPKINQCGQITYTYRDKLPDEETELDCMSTFNRNIRGVGSVLLSHFYEFCRSLNFKTIYIRSDIPKESIAMRFYEKMGCSLAEPHTIPWQTKTGPVYVTTYLYDPYFKIYSGPIVPMEISVEDARQISEEQNLKFQYTPLEKRSVPIEDVVELCGG